jgi:Protein of unknown function (DUF1566)/Repeat of unknown function (DUF5648)
MIYFNKSNLLLVLAVVLLTACGQSTTDSATTSTVQKTAQTSQAASILSPASSADLLTSLAVTYPNGQIPPANAAQAAKELAQNPAALHLTAQFTAKTAQSAATPIQSQAVAADYKAVTRIQNTTLTGAYFFTIYDTEQAAALAGNPNWKLEGAAFWASLASGTGLNPVHRFRNNLNGSYLYTIYAAEKTEIEANYASTFTYEGVAWYAQQTPGAGWSPLYRFRNLLNGTYLFSAYEAEKDAIVANYSAVFKLEGVAYYVRQDAPMYELLPTGSGGYYDKTECVKDTKTGLIWEGKPTSGLRMNTKTYTNFDSTTALQKYNVALGASVAPAQTDIDASTNSIGYKNSVNLSSLCGASNWRLPTKEELLTLVKSANSPVYDKSWFPNTADGTGDYPASSFYWTSTPDVYASTAWYVSFVYGNPSTDSREYTSGSGKGLFVRLVRR